MYSICKEYLIKKVEDAGIKTKVFVDRKSLEYTSEAHIGAVLFVDDNLERNGSKNKIEKNGNVCFQEKLFNRKMTFEVILGDYTEVGALTTFNAFINLIDKGINIEGNWTSIELGEIDWVEKGDSILKSALAVQMKITYSGGIYKINEAKCLTDVSFEIDK